MKFYILTYQRGGNEGAILQAYSLCSYLSNFGECKVIDYYSYPLCIGDTVSYCMNKRSKQIPYLKRLIAVYRRKHKFNKFLKNYIPMTYKIKQNTKTKLHCDFCFVGSDQLLNPLLNNFDVNYFYPSFIEGKKVLYGGSTITKDFVNNEHYKIIHDALIKYDAISVREESTEHLLKKITNDVKLVCDPVFLTSKEGWLSIIKKPKRHLVDKFIFVYYPNENLLDKAIEYSKKYHLKIYCISVYRKIDPSPLYELIIDDDPLEFLYLLSHSEFNFIGSFHGVCLSLILNKKFVSIFSKVAHEDRVNTALKKLALPNCHSFEDYEHFPIKDWEKVNTKIKEYKDDSKRWIEKVIFLHETN